MMIDVPNGVEQLLVSSSSVYFQPPGRYAKRIIEEEKSIIEWIVSRLVDVMKRHFDIFGVYGIHH